MLKAFRIISGIFLGLGPVVGLGVLGITLYAGFPSLLGLVLAGLLLFGGLWLGVLVFKQVQVVGPFELISSLHATPELDNLIPSEGGETKLISASDYVKSVKLGSNQLQGGAIRIFGDWFGKSYENMHTLSDVNFDSFSKELTMNFSEGEVLSIRNPRNIFEASTFMKILGAERVKLDWLEPDGLEGAHRRCYILYKKGKSKIETSTNVPEIKSKFHTSLSEPAIVIFGKFD